MTHLGGGQGGSEHVGLALVRRTQLTALERNLPWKPEFLNDYAFYDDLCRSCGSRLTLFQFARRDEPASE